MSSRARDVCPQCQEADHARRLRPRRRAPRRRGRGAVSRRARAGAVLRLSPAGSERLRAQLDAAARGEYDIVIGTQLVAKGHNFPLLTLVGVVDADVGLANGDPRAAERTFQLLRQATGRAGRGDKAGRALLQTWQPEHPVIAALLSGDAERFYAEETEQRRRGGLPPFGRLAAIIVRGEDRGAAEAHARALARAAHALPPGKHWRLAPIGGVAQGDEIVAARPGGSADRDAARAPSLPTRGQGAARRRPARVPARDARRRPAAARRRARRRRRRSAEFHVRPQRSGHGLGSR